MEGKSDGRVIQDFLRRSVRDVVGLPAQETSSGVPAAPEEPVASENQLKPAESPDDPNAEAAEDFADDDSIGSIDTEIQFELAAASKC